MNKTLTEPSPAQAIPVIVDATGDRDAVQRVLRSCEGERLEVIALPDLRKSNHWDMVSRVRFVLAEWSGESLAPLRTQLKLASVHLLPVAVLTPSALPDFAREALRKHGASMLLDGSAASDRSVRELLRSSQWFNTQLDRVPVPDTIQILAASNRSGVLVLACPHCRPFSAQSWSQTASACGGDGHCAGAVARIYMDNGRPTHAETPTDEGLDAFARCLSFKRGVGRFCEVFIPPSAQTLNGTATQLIIRAAAHADEAARSTASTKFVVPSEDLKVDMSTRGNAPLPPARPLSPKLPLSVTEQLKQHHPQAATIVHADGNGSVRDVAGQGDGDGVAAVAAIMGQAFSRATGSLGLGKIEGWTVISDESSCVAAVSGDDFVAATVPAPKDGFKQFAGFMDRTRDVLRSKR